MNTTNPERREYNPLEDAILANIFRASFASKTREPGANKQYKLVCIECCNYYFQELHPTTSWMHNTCEDCFPTVMERVDAQVRLEMLLEEMEAKAAINGSEPMVTDDQH
jgi:hypothetical protein